MALRNWKLVTAGTAVTGLALGALAGFSTNEEAVEEIDLISETERRLEEDARRDRTSLDHMIVTADSPRDDAVSPAPANRPDRAGGDSPDLSPGTGSPDDDSPDTGSPEASGPDTISPDSPAAAPAQSTSDSPDSPEPAPAPPAPAPPASQGSPDSPDSPAPAPAPAPDTYDSPDSGGSFSS